MSVRFEATHLGADNHEFWMPLRARRRQLVQAHASPSGEAIALSKDYVAAQVDDLYGVVCS